MSSCITITMCFYGEEGRGRRKRRRRRGGGGRGGGVGRSRKEKGDGGRVVRGRGGREGKWSWWQRMRRAE